MSRRAGKSSGHSRAVKAGAVSLSAALAAGIVVVAFQSASATTPVDLIRIVNPAKPWRADGAVTQADGVLPEGVTVFDHAYPGIANLDPDLLATLRDAATSAKGEGVEFVVHSAWRSPEYQDQLFREAVSTYGSRGKAARWVATADTSPHVSGDAVDLEPDARRWLSAHGARYGLCRIYRNEPWHFELRPAAIKQGCPVAYANPARDPRTKG